VATLLGASLVAAGANALAQAANRGGTLRIAFSSIRQLDPYKGGGNNDESNATALVFDALTFFNKDWQPKPLLAESWSAKSDTTWTFKLRQGVKFQDGNSVFPEGKGREVVAEDVVYSVRRFLKVANAFTLGNIASVRAVDRYTVEIRTTAPDPFFVSDPNRIARVGIVPREAIEKLGEAGFARQPVGSGPFELRTFTPNQTISFARNEDYWIPVNLDGVQLVFLPDPTVATIALQGGRVDAIPYLFNVDAVRQLSTNANIKLVKGFGSYRGLGFNVKTPPFDNRDVRDALSKALNIDAAVRSVVGQFGQRAYGQVPPWVPWGHDPSLKDLWSYDPEGAKQLLAKAGYTRNQAGMLVKDGKPLSFTIKTIAGSQVRVLTILVTQLKELGIDAKIQQQDISVWASDLVKGNETGLFFDFSYAGQTGFNSLFATDNIGTSNTHQYSNPQVDTLLAQAMKTVDSAKRGQLWKQAQRLVFQDRAGIPLYFENGYSAVRKNVMDWVPESGPLRIVSPENNVYLAK
jgi:peptide/nickel transport system substrate-binding protein